MSSRITDENWDVFPDPTSRKICVGYRERHNSTVRQVAECDFDDLEVAVAIAAVPKLLAALAYVHTQVNHLLASCGPVDTISYLKMISKVSGDAIKEVTG